MFYVCSVCMLLVTAHVLTGKMQLMKSGCVFMVTPTGERFEVGLCIVPCRQLELYFNVFFGATVKLL